MEAEGGDYFGTVSKSVLDLIGLNTCWKNIVICSILPLLIKSQANWKVNSGGMVVRYWLLGFSNTRTFRKWYLLMYKFTNPLPKFSCKLILSQSLNFTEPHSSAIRNSISTMYGHWQSATSKFITSYHLYFYIIFGRIIFFHQSQGKWEWQVALSVCISECIFYQVLRFGVT